MPPALQRSPARPRRGHPPPPPPPPPRRPHCGTEHRGPRPIARLPPFVPEPSAVWEPRAPKTRDGCARPCGAGATPPPLRRARTPSRRTRAVRPSARAADRGSGAGVCGGRAQGSRYGPFDRLPRERVGLGCGQGLSTRGGGGECGGIGAGAMCARRGGLLRRTCPGRRYTPPPPWPLPF